MAKFKKRPSSRKSIYLTDVEWAYIEKVAEISRMSLNKSFSILLAAHAFYNHFFNDYRAALDLYKEYIELLPEALEHFILKLEKTGKDLKDMTYDEMLELYPTFHHFKDTKTQITHYLIREHDRIYFDKTTPQEVKDLISKFNNKEVDINEFHDKINTLYKKIDEE